MFFLYFRCTGVDLYSAVSLVDSHMNVLTTRPISFSLSGDHIVDVLIIWREVAVYKVPTPPLPRRWPTLPRRTYVCDVMLLDNQSTSVNLPFLWRWPTLLPRTLPQRTCVCDVMLLDNQSNSVALPFPLRWITLWLTSCCQANSHSQ